VTRPNLDGATQTALKELKAKVANASDPKGKAASLWKSKGARTALQSVRAKLYEMAGGRGRCMYCEDGLGTDIEHFYPKAKYPKRAFDWKDNHLLACSHCNSNLKREKFPVINRRPTLLNPSVDEPAQHLAFLPSTGEFHPIGAKGASSIEVFGLNDRKPPRKLPQARQEVLLKLKLLIRDYDACCVAGDAAQAAFVKQTILDEPFPAMLSWLIATAQNTQTAGILDSDIPGLVERHAIASW
jgi:hypothetical protein